MYGHSSGSSRFDVLIRSALIHQFILYLLLEIEIEVVCSGSKIPQLDGGHDTSSSEDENFDDDDDHDDDDDEKEENEDGGGQEEVRSKEFFLISGRLR